MKELQKKRSVSKEKVKTKEKRYLRGKGQVVKKAGWDDLKLKKHAKATLSVTPIEGISYNYELPGSESFLLDEFHRTDFQRVVVAIPAIQDPTWFFVLALNAIAYPPNYSKSNNICWGREVGEARNHLVRQALEHNFQYLLFLDDDVLPTPDLYIKLLRHKTDIVSALYCTKSEPSYPLLFEKEGEGCFTDWELGDTVRVWGCGLGATLINLDIFRSGKISEPWFKTTKMSVVGDDNGWHMKSGTEDLFFYTKVMEAGYEVLVDTSIRCLHYDRLSKVRYPMEGFEQWYKNKRYLR